jgi:hypothetical protein
MRRILYPTILVLAFGLAACGKPASSAAAQDARKTADALTGDAAGAAADNPQCKMFSLAEIAAYGGAAVNPGKNAALGAGCQWPGASGDGTGTVMLQIVAAKDHSPPSGAAGFKKLSDVGTKGFVVPQMGGWQAGAIQGAKSINISTGGASSETKTIALLREALKRTGGQ